MCSLYLVVSTAFRRVLFMFQAKARCRTFLSRENTEEEDDDLPPSGEGHHRDLHSSSDDDDLSHWGRVSEV